MIGERFCEFHYIVHVLGRGNILDIKMDLGIKLTQWGNGHACHSLLVNKSSTSIKFSVFLFHLLILTQQKCDLSVSLLVPRDALRCGNFVSSNCLDIEILAV